MWMIKRVCWTIQRKYPLLRNIVKSFDETFPVKFWLNSSMNLMIGVLLRFRVMSDQFPIATVSAVMSAVFFIVLLWFPVKCNRERNSGRLKEMYGELKKSSPEKFFGIWDHIRRLLSSIVLVTFYYIPIY